MKNKLMTFFTMVFLSASAKADVVVADHVGSTVNNAWLCFTAIEYIEAGADLTHWEGEIECLYDEEVSGSRPTNTGSASNPVQVDEQHYYNFTAVDTCGGQDLRVDGFTEFFNGSGGIPEDVHAHHDSDDHKNCITFPPPTPLVVDLQQNGIQPGQRGTFVPFDYEGFGGIVMTQWLSKNSDDAFIALDLNNNGLIDDGSELFGNHTWLISQRTWAFDGFQALAQYDTASLGGNGDGEISSDDDIWNRLVLWKDTNADAVSDPGELQPLSSSVLRSIGIEATREAARSRTGDALITNGRRDGSGNLHHLWSVANSDVGTHKVVDIWFVTELP